MTRSAPSPASRPPASRRIRAELGRVLATFSRHAVSFVSGARRPHDPGHEADAQRDDGVREIAPDVAYRQLAIANVVFSGWPGAGDGQWVLIDAGVFGSGPAIRQCCTGPLRRKRPPSPHRSHPRPFRSCRRARNIEPRVERAGLCASQGTSLSQRHPILPAAGSQCRRRHGAAMRGREMRQALAKLARDFDAVAVPEDKRDSAALG